MKHYEKFLNPSPDSLKSSISRSQFPSFENMAYAERGESNMEKEISNSFWNDFKETPLLFRIVLYTGVGVLSLYAAGHIFNALAFTLRGVGRVQLALKA